MAIKITGLRETIHALNKIKHNMGGFLVHAAQVYAEKVGDVAREKCGVDTGALQGSVRHGLVSKTPEIKVHVVAGSDAVVRGTGKYKISRKTGQPASVLATSEYAEAHEDQTKFMANAVNWANSKAKRAVEDAIRKAIVSF